MREELLSQLKEAFVIMESEDFKDIKECHSYLDSLGVPKEEIEYEPRDVYRHKLSLLGRIKCLIPSQLILDGKKIQMLQIPDEVVSK